MKQAVQFLFLFLCTHMAFSQVDSSSTKRTLLAPDHYNVQFAGAIGMFSVGAEWHLLKRNLELGISAGFVPRFESEHVIYPTALRIAYTPQLKIKVKDVEIIPFAIGTLIARHHGTGLSKFEDPTRYPKGYYWWGIKTRYGVYHDLEIYAPVKNSRIHGMSFYFETSVWDIIFLSNFSNGNDDYFDRNDMWTFGMGMKIYLE